MKVCLGCLQPLRPVDECVCDEGMRAEGDIWRDGCDEDGTEAR